MPQNFFRSPIGKKLITGITGLGLVLFVLVHMTGNLTLLTGNDEAYNEYAHFLMSLGPLLYVIEAGLVAFFVFHIVSGISIWLGKRKARPSRYSVYQSAGSPSRQSLSSRSMIVTGIILMVFLVIHIATFKFGPGGPGNPDPAYLADSGIRDLAKLVREKFANPLYAFGYTAVMLLLILHLRHGVWSALQSLGAMKPRFSSAVYLIGGLLGAGIGLGFLAVPLALYFNLI